MWWSYRVFCVYKYSNSIPKLHPPIKNCRPPPQNRSFFFHPPHSGSSTEVWSRPLPGAFRRRAAGGCAMRWIVRRAGSAPLPSARLHPHMMLAHGGLSTRWARRRSARVVCGFEPDQHGALCWSAADPRRARAWRASAPDGGLCGRSCWCCLLARPFALSRLTMREARR
jgi:hypothetical protein